VIADCSTAGRDDATKEESAQDASRFHLCAGERWYVAMTLPRKERLAATNLANQHYRSFLPTHLETRRHARKFTTVLAPIFPRYIFVILELDRQRWRSVNGTLGVTFDDETTFTLSPNSRITVDNFVYQEGGANNAAVFNIIRGTVAFVASQVAKTGDMKIETPTAVMGIRGTSGLVEIPAGAAGAAAQVAIKLYPDADGRVGRIEVFGRDGAQLGILSRPTTGFAIRPGAPGRFAAVPLQISAQEAERDRSFVRQAFSTQLAGRQINIQRRALQRQNLQRQNQPRQNLQQPNSQRPEQLRPEQTKPPGVQPNLQRRPGVPTPPGAPRPPAGQKKPPPLRKNQGR